MRRLLAFGTGAAVIGLILLLVAFYESYIIVSQLQREIAQQGTTDVNLLLEDATLEAIFLGVMVALGYGLVSQGFSGIRRQELLDLEGTADDEITKARVMARIERERASERVRPKGQRMPAVLTPGKASAKISSPSSPFTSIPVASSESASNEPSKAEMTKVSSGAGGAPQPIVVAETMESSMTEDSSSSRQTLPTAEAELKKPMVAEPMVTMVSKAKEPAISMAQGVKEEEPGPAAVWEGVPPPALGEVEETPEPPNSTTTAEPPMESAETGQTTQSDQDNALAKPKRGRGRPKGSKSSKKKTDEVA